MTREQLVPWVERLIRAEPRDRTTLVGEMCKQNGLKVGEAWKLLKEAGFDSKAERPDTPQGDGKQADDADSGSDETARTPAPPGTGAPTQEPRQEPRQKPAKKRVWHAALKGKDLIVGSKTITFDADGNAELDAADAERLLSIPGFYEEVNH